MDITTSDLTAKQAKPVAPGRFFQRLFLSFIGAALIMAGFGVWLASSVAHDPQMLLIKLGISLFMLISGLCCLLVSKA
ncbi:hypothetical protein TRP8649_02768 [Pelagimonas phthalicica]|uniref:Uncharacterized protein n=1 Tax=Pelagimonas phthalicica TaxID=1037362 RepID=A0A238JE25_9RHOB|nr:hypothetical protein [Pelagimonas phthalicica]TDS91594.1 hypothetical protein CLV87_2769 [Pelagimonas phthalicica]SMX28643.1 hypothetical protein TRP8649_02768 [Pelagimonas phthalicica]